MGTKSIPADLPAPTQGYRDGALSLVALLKASRNLIVSEELYHTRPGCLIRRQIGPPVAKTYLERIPVDQSDGTLRAILHYAVDLVTDADSPSNLETSVYDPYAADANYPPSWVQMYGRTVWVANGAEFRILIHDGSSYLVRNAMGDPGDPTPTLDGSGHSVTVGAWFVRIREWDSKTNTYSAPNSRTATVSSVTVTGSGERIRVAFTATNPRADKWQVQLARATDSPGTYEIHYAPLNAASAGIGDSVGRIPVGTVDAYFEADPVSGTRFEYRTIGAQTLYRHTNPPPAHFVTEYRQRAFFAAADARWLVWSEVGNPEYFYHNTTDPELGFNTADGEAVISGVVSPCTGLAANESALLYFTRAGVVIGEGTWELVGELRRAQLTPLAQNGVGAISQSTAAKDQMVFFAGEDGLSVYAGGVPDLIDHRAVQHFWRSRDRDFDHRILVNYEPHWGVVVMAFVSNDAPIAGVPDVALAFNIRKRLWCPPWDFPCTAMTLHRLTTDGGVKRGTRLLVAHPYGTIGEWGVSWGDGVDASDTDTDETAETSSTTTSVTKTGAGWTVNEWAGRSLALFDATTGKVVYRHIKSNTADTINWDTAVSHSGGGWIFAIGGYFHGVHRAGLWAGGEVSIRRVNAQLDDQLSRRG